MLAVLWLASLPAYLAAAHGYTSTGTPVGSAPYALACLVFAASCLAAAFRRAAVSRVAALPGAAASVPG